MFYILTILIGFGAGFLACHLALEQKRRKLENDKEDLEKGYDRISLERSSLREKKNEVAAAIEALNREKAKYATIESLTNENSIIKRDLANMETQFRKTKNDQSLLDERQASLMAMSQNVAEAYLSDNLTWLKKSLTQNNFTLNKNKLLKVIESCRGLGFEITEAAESGFLSDLQEEYEAVVRQAFHREQQAKIRAQIREEQKRQQEFDLEIQRLNGQRDAIKAALDEALSRALDEHSAEIQDLRRRLSEAEERTARAISQAQITKAGHVYVISNIGSFGEGVYKIGLTRRLEPLDRIRELSGASVPFPFDVHMMISSDNAPELESQLHRDLHSSKVNKVNPRKEFFRVSLDEIVKVVESNYGEIDYIAEPEALDFRQTQEMAPEDQAFIEEIFDRTGFSELDDDT